MTFKFPILISLIPVFIAIAVILAGVYTRYRDGKSTGIYVSLAGFGFLVLFGPMLFLDTVKVSSRQIVQSTGFWFHQTQKHINLTQTQYIEISGSEDGKGKTLIVWKAYSADGSVHIVDPGDLWESNTEEIVGYLANQGFEVRQIK
ncbi:hypothetical protein FE810_12250 [Thalassotalea litorea]|uniref:Uncharacterized protein n=1 Tax=Thalassotalea litorea TaxID=2020715 RepID=A0A5R9IFS4_9GAMM|nr:hypothetical protein [Thalassotalea litorea]TLU64364.1 hypothetical protein FE810_12250 [Thalassotalea litorea]